MAGPTHLHLVILGTAVSFSMAFNIDISQPKIYNGSREDFFGFKVLQFQSDREKGIFVSAPLQNHGTGGVFICDDTSPNCRPLPGPQDSYKEVGMTLAVKTKPSLQFTACSPAWSHECGGTPYLNSICYQWSSRGSIITSNITSTYKAVMSESSKQRVDVVLLFDGSLSMTDADFIKTKEFMKNIMNSMENTSIQFAAVQFSKVSRTVFTFKDFQDKTAFDKLNVEPHMKSLTNTHQAMRFTLVNLFDNPESGGRPDAVKAVVIITDGNPSDTDRMGALEVGGKLTNILQIHDDRHIIRFVIAVGNERIDMDKLQMLASEPRFWNSYYIESYAGLDGLLTNLQTKIFKIQERPKQKKDVVFLFDGSLSMTDVDFIQTKEFMKDIMNRMEDTSIQFAAVQFSKEFRTVFTFKDFQDKTAFGKLNKEPHMRSLTNTHKAMRFTLVNLFDNPESGRRPDAVKVVVIITDGNPSDTDRMGALDVGGKLTNILQIYKDRNIIRFVIAVGNEEIDMGKLRLIASEPGLWNSYYIASYVHLNGLLTNLQKKIFEIQGCIHNLDREEESLQSRINAEFAEDMLILGAVGSNNWRGSLYRIGAKNSAELETQNPFTRTGAHMENNIAKRMKPATECVKIGAAFPKWKEFMREKNFQMPMLHAYFSTGYSVAVGKKNGIPLYFTGSPTLNQRGQVSSFRMTGARWTALQIIDSEQIGSHFGSELCDVDIDSDGNTDFLMVGAPLSSEPQREGRMYVFVLTGENKLEKVQNVSVSSQGRFASSIAVLRDLNGDGLQDLAVGAPLEDDQRGAIYIYLGDKTTGVRPKYSQHIRAKMLSESLQQFGVTIDGKSEVDGRTEIAVGARGHVVLLRT